MITRAEWQALMSKARGNKLEEEALSALSMLMEWLLDLREVDVETIIPYDINKLIDHFDSEGSRL